MTCLSTAKILLFIALTLSPGHRDSVIYATSNSESYVWSPDENGWTVKALGFPASDFTRDPSRETSFDGRPMPTHLSPELRAISHHDWRHNSIVILSNGDRVEKYRDHAFYILNAGGPNEKVFTILYGPKE